MKKKTTFLAMAVTAIAFALAGCHSNKGESEILRPISENFVGRWKLIDHYLLDENGKLCLDKAKLIVYSHGEYLSLGKKLGTFGYSVRKKKPGKRKK